MSSESVESLPQLSDGELQLLRQRGRVLLLLDAAERAAVAPLSTDRLHTLAFLADVLSPVWNLSAFDQVVICSEKWIGWWQRACLRSPRSDM